MKKSLLYTSGMAIAILFALNLSAQNQLSLKLPVSSFFGDAFSNSLGFGLGIELPLKNGFALNQEAGYIFKVEGVQELPGSSKVDDINGFKATTELRKYLFNDRVPANGLFISAEMDNIFTQSTLSAHPELGEISRYRNSVTLNIGTKFFWNQEKNGRLTFDLMLGGGIGYLQAESENDLNTESSPDYAKENSFSPWLNLDIKIGYLFGKGKSVE